MTSESPYRVLGPLGAGAMGAVFRALQVSLKREVALKTMRPELLDDADAKARFEREARAMMRVRHPNVVEVLDAGVAGGQPYIAMALVQGRTLAELAKVEPVRMRGMADRVFAQVLDGVAALHEAGLVHRDLKPQNVMVTGDGRAIVMDLGLVRDERADRTGLTATGLAVGTPHYLAPEAIRGARSNAGSDVWALGCLYFFLHAGRNPFGGQSLEELYNAILHASMPDLAVACGDMPEHRRAFLRALLERDPERRPADAAAARGLFAAAEPRPERVRKRRRERSRALPAVALVGIALAGVVTGLALVGGRGRERVVALGPPVTSPAPESPAPAPSAGPASSAEVIAALEKLDVPSLTAVLDRDMRTRPLSGEAQQRAILNLREQWTGRIQRALAHARLPEIATRAALDGAPASPAERLARYRLAIELWLLLGRLRELKAEPRIDALALFPREWRPEVGVPLLGRARSVGVRWRDSELLVPLMAPAMVWIPSPQKGDVRLIAHKSVEDTVELPMPLGLHDEPAVLPLPPPAPGERVLAVLGAKHLGPATGVTLKLNGAVRAVFRGERDGVRAAHAHWIDPEAFTGPTRVRLELRQPAALSTIGETYLYWLMFHYVPGAW